MAATSQATQDKGNYRACHELGIDHCSRKAVSVFSGTERVTPVRGAREEGRLASKMIKNGKCRGPKTFCHDQHKSYLWDILLAAGWLQEATAVCVSGVCLIVLKINSLVHFLFLLCGSVTSLLWLLHWSEYKDQVLPLRQQLRQLMGNKLIAKHIHMTWCIQHQSDSTEDAFHLIA